MNAANTIVLPEKFGFDCYKWFDEQSFNALRDGRHVELDCSKVSYIDSAALGMIVVLYRRAKEVSASVLVRNPSSYCDEVFELTNIYDRYVCEMQ
ncbi:anti-sigma factor antagonist [Marinomonas piezotolerans]|uniref:Anti-sigma factor antagonist n=1 Tax=Marinomonas piezotolerans TaxID=2213058 RepID=A0A370UEG4_9GAMM|nr:STAS domain-containing protein [Marinomonas piezotolerans]RDL46172.1 anti-sigma factor antagonist [Marinomonas piezotolerans]